MIRKILPAIAALLAYGRLLVNGAGFSHPDDLLAWSASIHGPRPLYALTIMFNKIAGGWMLTNVALHVVCSVLVAAIAWRLFGDDTLATLAGCLFAVHPLAADAVASVAGRSMLLCGMFMFTAILLMLDKRSLWLVCIAAAPAFFVREDAGALFILLPLIAYTQGRYRFTVTSVMCLSPAVALLAMIHQRVYAASVIPPGTTPDMAALYTPVKYFGVHYLEAMVSTIMPRIFLPINLSAEPFVATGLEFLVVFGIIAMWLIKVYSSDYSIGKIIVALALAPLLIYAFSPLSDIFLEHRAYIALAGFMIFAVNLMRKHAVLLGTIAVTVLIWMSVARCEVYATPVSLWADAVAKNPEAPRAHINYGMALYTSGRYDDARRELIAASGRLRLGLTNLMTIEAKTEGQKAMSTMSRQMDLIDPVPEYHR